VLRDSTARMTSHPPSPSSLIKLLKRSQPVGYCRSDDPFVFSSRPRTGPVGSRTLSGNAVGGETRHEGFESLSPGSPASRVTTSSLDVSCSRLDEPCEPRYPPRRHLLTDPSRLGFPIP
jgi:hypothetical protein